MRKVLAILIILAWPLSAWAGVTYYISNANPVGSDSNNGTSTSTPWLTIAQVNSSTFSPGDSILFNSGCTWSGQLTVASSGISGAPITIGSYGSGAKPIINPSTVVSSWTLVSGSVYDSNISALNLVNFVYMVCEDNIPLQIATSDALSDGQWYYSYPTLYYKPSSGTPSSHVVTFIQDNTSTSATTYNCGINLSNQSYINITGIELIDTFVGVITVETTAQSNNISVTYCSFLYNAYSGIQFFTLTGASNGNLSNNYFEYCAQGPTLETQAVSNASTFNNFTMNYNTVVGVGAINGTTAWNTVTGKSNDEEGIGAQDLTNSFIEYNTITGGISNQGAIVLYNNNSGISSGNLTAFNLINGVNGGGNGLLMWTGGTNSGYNGNQTVYNIIINSTGYPFSIGQGTAATVQNLFANNVIAGNNGDPILILSGTSIYLTFKNNILFNNSGSQTYFTGVYNTDVPDATFICDYNLYPAAPTFGSSNTSKTWAQWQALGYDTHAVVGNPLFTNGSGAFDLATDFTLQPGSPAIHAGTVVGLTQDFAGNLISGVPDIGAFEFIQKLSPPTNLRVIQ